MKIIIGSDEAGFDLKKTLLEFFDEKGYDVEDYGVYNKNPSLYPETALKVAKALKEKKAERGILICGTGIGMAISANKVSGIRAAQTHDVYSAIRAKKSNDAHIITLGARVIGEEKAKMIVEAYLTSNDVKSSSLPKIDKIKEIETIYNKEES